MASAGHSTATSRAPSRHARPIPVRWVLGATAMLIKYRGRWHGVKYAVSIAHGLRVWSVNVAMIWPRRRATKTRDRFMSDATPRSEQCPAQCPLPNTRVSSSAVALRRDAMALASPGAASSRRILGMALMLVEPLLDALVGHQPQERD